MKIKSIKNILKNYRWQSFLIRNFIVIFCILIFPLAIFSFIIMNNHRNSMIQSINHSDTQSTMLMTDFLDRNFSEIENFFININSSDLYSNDFRMMLSANDISRESLIESSENIMNYVKSFMTDNKIISSVYIYSNSSDYVFSSGFPSSNYLSDFHDSHVITNDYVNNYPFYRNIQINRSNYDMISVIYPVNNSKVIFNINISILKQYLIDINTNLNGLSVLDFDNRLLFSTDRKYSLFKVHDAFASLPSGIDKNNIIKSTINSKELNLKYIFENHYPDYTRTKQAYLHTIILLILLMLTLTICISVSLTMALYKHILSLIDILHPYIPSTDENVHNELQLITNSIINITSQNSDLREELTNRLNALKTAQVSMLQTQINPHFLYNTLNSINSIVLFTFKKETQISDIITNLSEILRYSSNASEYLVPLETELYYLKKYIDIQKSKYINRFSIEFHISDNTKNLKLIKLSLQPLVENSILHGILPKRSHGTIHIYSSVINNALVVKIEDDGIGLNSARLKELNERINNDVFVLDKSLGIENTAKRIRLIFGNSYGLGISSSEHGTAITLTMPVIE